MLITFSNVEQSKIETTQKETKDLDMFTVCDPLWEIKKNRIHKMKLIIHQV